MTFIEIFKGLFGENISCHMSSSATATPNHARSVAVFLFQITPWSLFFVK
jgi:hypothetical protein